MTAIPMNDTHNAPHDHVHVWHCDGCHCFHIRATGVLLTFTPSEFAAFSNSVSDCYWENGLRNLVTDDAPRDLFAAIPHNDTLN